MTKHRWLATVAIILACAVSAAAPPLPLDKVISADDLVAEAAAKGAEIEPYLASAEAFDSALEWALMALEPPASRATGLSG